ncbi:MAG: peptidylprolyl isomerase [Fuerstiella sp.]|mgnify:CR=1 FL=1
MNFRRLFNLSKPAKRFQGRRSQGLPGTLPVARLERLEERALLAGNVTAQLVGQTAFINGDAADNSVQILVDGGNVVVRGADGTTINGSSNDFVLATGSTSIPGSLYASLDNGNDTFTIDGVTLPGNAFISGGSGNDQIAVMGSSTISGNLHINGNSGADTISLQNSTVGRNATILGARGADTLIVSSATIGRDLYVSGGSNNDNIVVDNSRIGRDTTIVGLGGEDNIVLRDSVFVDDITIAGHGGNDIIVFDSSDVGDKSFIFGGGGRDNIQITGSSTFYDRLRTYGGGGRDNLETASTVTFDGLKRSSFSGRIADAAAIESRINNAVTGAIAIAEAAVLAFDPQLSLALNTTSISEAAGNGAATLTVSRESASDTALEVQLTSSNTSRLTLAQSTVTIPAGQTSVTVQLNAVNDTTVGNTEVVTITATANGLNARTIELTVTDDDAESLSVSANVSTIEEDTGGPSTVGTSNSVDFTITRTGSTTEALVVNLTGSPSGVFTVPATATIAAGNSSATISIPTIGNTTVGSDVTFTLTATATGLASGNTSVVVLDNDSEQLSVAFSAPTITETGSDSTATITVSRNSATTSELTVTLTSQDPDSVTFAGNASTTVVIPAGSSSATVQVSGVEENIDDGDLTVAVIASATGFSSGSETIVAADDDNPALTIALSGSDVVAENAGTAAVSAVISRNTVDTSTDVVVTLTRTGDTRLAVPTSVTIPAGQASVNVTFDTVDNNIVESPANGTAIVSAAASGFFTATTSVTVTNDDVATITLTPSALSVSETAGIGGASLTLTRNNSAADETVNLAYSNPALVTGPATVTFIAGETTANVSLDIIDNSLYAANALATVTASATGHADVMANIGVTNDENLSLTVDTSSNTVAETVGAIITKNASFTITGQTAPNATVQVDTNGDSAFDEGATTADASGNYSVTVTLANDSDNEGRNYVQVRSLIVAESVDTVSSPFEVQLALGTVVRFGINQDLNNDGTNDFYDVELLDDDAPITVANFLSYVDDGSYQNLIVHRSPFNFVIQGGGFTVNNSAASNVPTKGGITNESSLAGNSNFRGTLSMALIGGQPSSGTSQWFINIANNTGLDTAISSNPAVGHTVFGRVLGNGMSVVDAINQLPVFDLSLMLNQSALGETPLVTSPLTQLTGTVNLTANSTTITGNGTSFTSELLVGDVIQISGRALQVTSITSDTVMTVDSQASASQSGLRADGFTSVPADDDFVVFSDIGRILDSI